MDELSIDDVVSLMGETDHVETEAFEDGADDATQEADHEIVEGSPDPDVDLEDAPETASEDEVEDDAEEDAPETASVEAPWSWEAEDKAAFAKLSPEDQQRVLKYEEKSRKAAATAMESAANERKLAQAEQAQTVQHRAAIDTVLQQAVAVFQSRWADIDWPRYISENPERAAVDKAQHDAELQMLQHTTNAKQQLEAQESDKYLQSQAAKLREMGQSDPDAKQLLDPESGERARTAVVDYLVSRKVPLEDIRFMSAEGWLVANDAAKYRQLLARRAEKQAQPEKRNTSQAQALVQRTRAPTAQGKPQQVSKIESQTRRLSQTRKADDLVALLDLQDASSRPKGR